MTTASLAKFNMIEQQIRPWEVIDRQVLDVIDRLDRVDFVPAAYRGLAYADCQLPLGHGVRMLPPTIEGRLLQALLIGADDRALEVGCASGYLTACLAELAATVTSIDAREAIVEMARANIAARGYVNIEFECLALDALDRPGQFDVIAVTASLPAVPANLREALAPGGRLFAVIGESPAMEAVLVTRLDEAHWQTRSLFETDLPRLND